MAAALGNNRGRGRGKIPPGFPKIPANMPGNGGTTAPAPAGANARPARGAGRGKRPQQQAGIGGAALPGPGGRQLAARVSSGAITQEQAQKTMQQRQTLAKALGPNWRDKLQVGGKSFAQVNKQLKANPGNAKLTALRKRLAENRKSLLEGARKPKKKPGADTETGE